MKQILYASQTNIFVNFLAHYIMSLSVQTEEKKRFVNSVIAFIMCANCDRQTCNKMPAYYKVSDFAQGFCNHASEQAYTVN